MNRPMTMMAAMPPTTVPASRQLPFASTAPWFMFATSITVEAAE